MKYLRSCLWLICPAMAFNVVFAASLPPAFAREVFWRNIPWTIAVPENLLRLVVFTFPTLMVIRLDTSRQRAGLVLYVLGTAVYFLSWGLLIWQPASAWSMSTVGFLAPAYSPLLWLLGMALVGGHVIRAAAVSLVGVRRSGGGVRRLSQRARLARARPPRRGTFVKRNAAKSCCSTTGVDGAPVHHWPDREGLRRSLATCRTRSGSAAAVVLHDLYRIAYVLRAKPAPS